MPRPVRLVLASLALAAPLAQLSAGVAGADTLIVPVAPCEHVVIHHVTEPVVVTPAPLLSVPIVAPVVVG